jgi:hypothetical protein
MRVVNLVLRKKSLWNMRKDGGVRWERLNINEGRIVRPPLALSGPLLVIRVRVSENLATSTDTDVSSWNRCNYLIVRSYLLRRVRNTGKSNALTLQNAPCLLRPPPTDALLSRVLKLVHALRLHLNTVTGLCGCGVVTILDDTGVEEVLVQVVDVLQHRQLARDDDIVDS